MKVVRMVLELFTDNQEADQGKPTDQAVSNHIRASRDASIDRQQKRAQREQHALIMALRHQDQGRGQP